VKEEKSWLESKPRVKHMRGQNGKMGQNGNNYNYVAKPLQLQLLGILAHFWANFWYNFL
jgi:hypothetical protein